MDARKLCFPLVCVKYREVAYYPFGIKKYENWVLGRLAFFDEPPFHTEAGIRCRPMVIPITDNR